MQAPASGISLSAAAAVLLAISADAGARLQLGLRFVHLPAGILRVGLLYFFTLVFSIRVGFLFSISLRNGTDSRIALESIAHPAFAA